MGGQKRTIGLTYTPSFILSYIRRGSAAGNTVYELLNDGPTLPSDLIGASKQPPLRSVHTYALRSSSRKSYTECSQARRRDRRWQQ